MNDDSIVSLFTDDEISQFVKFALVLPCGNVLFDLKLRQAVPVIGVDISQVYVYLDLARIYHDVGVDLSSVGPDPMKAPEAFFLKLLWPGYIDSDEKYLAIIIAGILSTRSDQDRVISQLPPFSMHLTEVGMHLKMLEAVDASLAWALPNLKQEGLRLARFLAKRDTARYFSVTASPYHHSDKVVSLNHEVIWQDAGKVWAVHDVSVYLSDLVRAPLTDAMEIAEHLEFVTQSCAEAALDDQVTHHDLKHIELSQSIENSIPSKFTIHQSASGNDGSIRGQSSSDKRPFGRELNGGNTKLPHPLLSNKEPLFGASKNTVLEYGRSEKGAGMEAASLDFDRENFNRFVM